MNLKNYTSTVPASSSMAKIEKCLVEVGATDITKKYNDDKICISVSFRMMVNGSPLFFQLPIKVETCFKVLWAEIKKPQASTKRNVLEQAERTAWKIVSDWVEIQLSMILLQQAEIIEIFLPYVYNPETDKTFFQMIKANDFKQISNG